VSLEHFAPEKAQLPEFLVMLMHQSQLPALLPLMHH
jgi:hypothetical protein